MNEDQSISPPRRTAAIWLALVPAFLFAAGSLFSMVQRRSDFSIPVLAVAGGASFISLLCNPRSRITYFITVLFLTVLVVRGFVVDVILLLRPPAPGAPTQSYSSYAFNVFIDFLWLLLLWRYTTGSRTRNFYGLTATPQIRSA